MRKATVILGMHLHVRAQWSEGVQMLHQASARRRPKSKLGRVVDIIH